MYVTVTVVNPEEVRVAMTIEMPLRSWKAIRQVLAQETWRRADTYSIAWEIINNLDVATTRIETAIALKTLEESL